MKNLSLYLFLAGLLPLSLSADWQLVKDFNDGSFDGINTLDTNHSDNFDTIGIIDLVPRPFDEQGGMSLATSAGFGLFNDFHIWMDIPAIADGSDGTVYFEFSQSDQSNNTAFGTTNVDEIGDPLWRWGIFSALGRVNFGSFDVFDEDAPGYVNVGTKEANTWYKLWFHVDNAIDEHTVYIQGGEWEEQTLIYSEALFRNFISVDDQIKFLIIQAAGNQDNPTSGQYVYWDNLFVDPTGLNLSVPETGVDPVENPFDDLIAGDWTEIANFGLIFGIEGASNWVYHHSLGFIFTGEFPWIYHPNGGWLYYANDSNQAEEMALFYSVNHEWMWLGSAFASPIFVFSGDEWVVLDFGN
jgi:hypothetical protein